MSGAAGKGEAARKGNGCRARRWRADRAVAAMTEKRLEQLLENLRGELHEGPFGPIWLQELAAEIRRLWKENAELRARLAGDSGSLS